MREITYAEAIREATEYCLEQDTSVYVMGLGVPDMGAIFGTTKTLQEKFGAERVFDIPAAENGMTGIAIGSAIAGMRPVMIHQRVDFMLLAIEQIVNQAAKWHYMFDGKMRVPLVIRTIIGRGWGQGAQHSQSLHSWFAHIPGLKVVMPFSPYDAKGLLIASIEDNNPVIFIEHRWLHSIAGHVPTESYRVPIGKARTAHAGNDITIAATSYTVLEALRAANELEKIGISAEVIDMRSLRPIDSESLLTSVRKTGRFIAVDHDWEACGFAGELLAIVCENAFNDLKTQPARICLPDHPLPTAPSLAKDFYPGFYEIICAVCRLTEQQIPDIYLKNNTLPHDVPDRTFTGPF